MLYLQKGWRTELFSYMVNKLYTTLLKRTITLLKYMDIYQTYV